MMVTISYFSHASIQGREQLFEKLADIEASAFSDVWTSKMLAASMKQPWNHLWTASVQGEICGYLLANLVAEETELLRIAVDKNNRNAGIGKMLMESYLAFAKKSCTRGLLEVRHSNAAARHLYETNGYRMLAVRKNYYNNPAEDAELYELDFGDLHFQ